MLTMNTRLAIALTCVLASYRELLECCNEELPDNGAGPMTEDQCVLDARELLKEQKDFAARLRWDINPDRSALIDDIENAEDAEAERDARAALDRFDADDARVEESEPSPAEVATALRRLADQCDAGTMPQWLFRLAARQLNPEPAAAAAG